MAGTLNNLGKVVGPILGGVLVGGLGYVLMFRGMGAMLICAGAVVWLFAYHSRTRHRVLPLYVAASIEVTPQAAGRSACLGMAIHRPTPSAIHRMESSASASCTPRSGVLLPHDAFQ